MYKIDMSFGNEKKVVSLKGLDYESFGCREVKECRNMETCDNCIFNYIDLAKEEILNRLIENKH